MLFKNSFLILFITISGILVAQKTVTRMPLIVINSIKNEFLNNIVWFINDY